jgi:1-phosphatidylinositol phosphodiesterase
MTNKNPSNWMSQLDDNLLIHQLSIPGTHDSGTAKISAGPSHTQNFGISRQLADGIRFLDIRVAENSSKSAADPLQVNHGSVSCDITFGSVLNDCRDFLAANPSEIILMLVNDAHDKKDLTAYNGFAIYLKNDAYKNLFYLNPTPGQLSQIRGKILLMHRFTAPAGVNLGLDYQKWGNNSATFEITTPAGQITHIEDEYKEHNVGDKKNAVYAALNFASNNPDDGKLYLTFNSIASNGSKTPYMYAWTTKNAMNTELKTYLSGVISKSRLGIVVVDYYNNEGDDNQIAASVVNSNFNA